MYIVRCAASKGRSSSRAISKFLARLSALCVVGGLYVVFGFILTRWNLADDPTRDVARRSPIPGMDLAAWDRSDLFRLSCLPRSRRWVSVCGPVLLKCSDPSCFPRAHFPYGVSACSLDFSVTDPPPSMEFGSILGFPGESPAADLVCLGKSIPVVRLSFAMFLCCAQGVLVPRHAGDLQRQTLRNAPAPLQEGHPVLSVITELRSSCLEQFECWLRAQGRDLEMILGNPTGRVDEINRCFVCNGRCLCGVGRPYDHYAETINAIAAKKPILRRQLQEAWKILLLRVRDEPTTHHIAIPWQVLLACISVCQIWPECWLALTWGAILRVGEFRGATRKDLLLRGDTNFTNSFALLALKEPKARFAAARHQCAKLDVPDLLRVVHLAFSRLHPLQRLWPRSGQTLRLATV